LESKDRSFLLKKKLQKVILLNAKLYLENQSDLKFRMDTENTINNEKIKMKIAIPSSKSKFDEVKKFYRNQIFSDVGTVGNAK
jgi:regulator of replication initiation timing